MATQRSADETRRVRLLAVIMAGLVLVCTGMTVLFLFRTAIESQQRWLTQVVDSQAQLIKAAYHATGGDRGKVFRIVKEAQSTYQFRNFRHTGEVILFREVGDQILVMLGLRDGHAIGLTHLKSDTREAALLRRTLASDGIASTYVGPDRLGNRVIAGYIALPELGWGLVAKVDFWEVAAPFVRAAMAAVLIAVIGIWLGTRAFQRINDALIRRIRNAKEFSENLVQNLVLPTFVIDRDHRVLVWNRAMERLTGVAADQVVGSHGQWRGFHRRPRPCLADLVIDGGADAGRDLYSSIAPGALVSGGLTAESWCDMPDGSKRYLGMDAGPIVDRDGGLLAVVQTVHDMTESKNMGDALLVARDQALEGSRAKSAFLATMSHELRTPMNGVLGMLDILRGSRLTRDQGEYVEIAHQSAVGLLEIINDILDISKIESGKLELEHVGMDIRDLVDEVCRMLAQRAHAKGLELVADLPPDIPTAVCGDPTRFRQVLVNLLGNAIKFTERGVVSVSVQPVSVTPQSLFLRVSVSDTGVGISDEAMSRLFKAFSQADGSTTRRFGGTGLGLAICKQLVQLMGGDIGVESRPGEGATFWLTVEFERQQVAAPEIPDRRLAGTRALVVDDSAASRGILERDLEAWGIRATGLADGDAALAEMRHAGMAGAPYDFTLIAAAKTGVNGLAVANAMQADPALCSLPRVLLVNALHVPDAGTLSAAGVAACLPKPVRQAQLHETLCRVVSNPLPRALDDIPPSIGALNGRRVLLVEDNPVNQLVAATMLNGFGMEVIVAEDGRQAVEFTARDRFDVVLMDCQMPELDGFAATREIRRGEAATGAPRQVIIAMTANAMKGDRQLCLDAGMDDYITKPVQVADLEQHLLRWCASNSSVAIDEVDTAPLRRSHVA